MTAISRTLMLTVILAACFAAAVAAQPTPAGSGRAEAAVFTPASPAAYEGAFIPASDVAALEAASWRGLDRRLADLLDASDEQGREQAMQQIIYLATYYPEQSDFGRVVTPLLDIYIRSGHEGHRILALTALHAIGNDAAMRHLAQYVRVDRSARVQRLTKHALIDYFGTK